MINTTIIIALVIQGIFSIFSKITGAILGFFITTGILIWGLTLYNEGSAIQLSSFQLTQPIFVIACLVWYGYDILAFLKAKSKAKEENPTQSSNNDNSSPKNTTTKLSIVIALFSILIVLGYFYKDVEKVLLKGLNQGLNDEWTFSELTDKITLEKKIIASSVLIDKDSPSIRVSLEMVCNKNKELYLSIMTNSSKEVNNTYDPIDLIFEEDNQYHYIQLKTRSGNNNLDFLGVSEDVFETDTKPFTNRVFMSVDRVAPNKIANIINNLTSLLNPSSALTNNNPAIDRAFISNEWFIKLPTVNGSPVIKIDLNSPSLKKLYGACNFKPEFLKNQTATIDSKNQNTGKTDNNDGEANVNNEVNTNNSKTSQANVKTNESTSDANVNSEINTSNSETIQTAVKTNDTVNQEGYSDSYNKCMENSGGVTVEMNSCVNQEYELQDTNLNKAYKEKMALLDNDKKAELKSKQREWIKIRDKECNEKTKNADVEGGTAETIILGDCLLEKTTIRVNELLKM